MDRILGAAPTDFIGRINKAVDLVQIAVYIIFLIFIIVAICAFVFLYKY